MSSNLVKLFSQLDFSIEEYIIQNNTDEKKVDQSGFVDENINKENEEADMTFQFNSDDDYTEDIDEVYSIPKMSSIVEDIIEIF